MVVECVAVIIVISMTAYFYFVAKKPNISLSIFPLSFVPIMYLFGSGISGVLERNFGFEKVPTISFFVLIGAVTACVIFGYFSSKLRKKTSKMFYNIFCSGFTVIFAWVIILKII